MTSQTLKNIKQNSKLAGFTAAALLLPASPLLAQNTGTAHPETLHDDVVVTTTTDTATHYRKPSPAVPVTTTETTTTVATPALRTREYTTNATMLPATQPTETYAAVRPVPHPERDENFVVTDDVNSGVVTDVEWRANELPEGTILRARLSTEISTTNTEIGSTFQARLTHPIEHRGRVILPVGSVITGRVSDLHGGHRIGGAALIHLQPESITLPDGSVRHLVAQVTDLTHPHGTHVNNEGTIVGNDHSKGTLAAVGLTTGSAAVAGAMIGGGVGAAVGAGIGAGVATVWWLKRENHQTLTPGTDIVFSLNQPLLLEPMNR